MGFGDWFRGQKARGGANAFAGKHDDWGQRVATLEERIGQASDWSGEILPLDSGFVLAPGESAYLVLEGAALVEGKRLPGRWSGGSQGVSLRVMRGVSYRVGGTRGTYTQGDETLAAIDTGRVLLTNERAVFAGDLQTREWDFDKLLGYRHDAKAPITYLQVSNRQKVSGFGYDLASLPDVRFRFDLAIAEHTGTRAALRQKVEQELVALKAQEPPAFPAERSTPLQPGWHPDPDGKGQRYWSGTTWSNDTAP